MPRKRTIEELKEQAKAAEERAKKLREQAKRLTQLEEAKLNAEILHAVEEWRISMEPQPKREELPALFREWAAGKFPVPSAGKTDSLPYKPGQPIKKDRF